MKLSDRAMLIKLSITGFSPSKKDKKVTEEVERTHATRSGMARVSKYTIHPDTLRDIQRIDAATREAHYTRTLPWMNDGTRILTSKAYMSYADMIRKQEAEWTAAVEAFCSKWDQHIEDARQALNGMFDIKDYPTQEELRKKFRFEWQVLPIPEGEDFRVQLGQEEIAVIRQRIEEQNKAIVTAATRDVWERLRECVSKMSERLHASSNTGAPFRDSLVENIVDLLAVVPSINLTDDPQINEFCQEIRSRLTAYSPDKLRTDYAAKRDTMKAADEILSKISAFLA